MGLNIVFRFLTYGAIGLVLEVIWTGLGSLINRDFTLRSSTSIWMFFIYGMVVVLEPAFVYLTPFSLFIRGIVYMFAIFAGEYLLGIAMKKADICPWDYSDAALSIQGVIRLDYAPVWFAAGLIFEAVYMVIR